MLTNIVEQHIKCPMCPSSDAYCIYDDGHGYCFSCKYYKPSREVFVDQEFTYEFLPRRGIYRSTLEFYDCMTKIDAEGKPVSVGYKYPWGDFKVRKLDSKDFYWEKKDVVRPGLYGRDKFPAGSANRIYVTEGEEDAHSIRQVTGYPAVSVQSSSSAVRDCTVDRDYILSFGHIYLAFDNDTPGAEATRGVARMFDYTKVNVVKFSNRKDANEYLQAGEPDLLRKICENAQHYLPETVVTVDANNLDELLGEAKEPGVPYPWKSLNEMTNGIRRGESVLITAPEGVGKTQLMHTIEYQLLKETPNDTGIGAIFIEEDKRDHLYALAGIHLKKPVHLHDSGVARDEVKRAIQECTQVDGRLHIYNHFGSDDPDVFLDTIRFMVVCRGVAYVLVDHVGILVSGLRDERDERRALDYISTRLAMMIKELNFGLIEVSHVNDLGQTRGSRLIAKDAHIRLDLSRNVMAETELEKNTLHLSISKNRPMRKTGKVCSLLFDTVTNQYTET